MVSNASDDFPEPEGPVIDRIASPRYLEVEPLQIMLPSPTDNQMILHP